jgi:hypothetical protein
MLGKMTYKSESNRKWNHAEVIAEITSVDLATLWNPHSEYSRPMQMAMAGATEEEIALRRNASWATR